MPLPLPVLGGVMVMVAVDLIDRQSGRQLLQWWREPRSADLRAGLGVMLLVCGVTLWQGFAAGVGLGVLLSMTILIVRMNRSLLRSRLSAAQQPSRRVYPAAMAARLQPLRAQIQIWELEGALFFGNAERLLELADELGPEVKALVLDLRRVSTIDETGAAALASLGSVLQRRQVLLLPAGVAAATAAARALQDFGLALQPDADRAIEAAERHLLGPQADPLADPLAELPLADCDLLRGLDDTQKALVIARMPQLQLAAGQTLFRQGDAADGLYVLTQGWVSVFGDTGATPQRLLSISPGLMLGETAMLDGGGRSASAVADSVAQLHRLDRASLQALAHDHPAVANTLHRNIALHLSTRLRSATSAWSASQG